MGKHFALSLQLEALHSRESVSTKNRSRRPLAQSLKYGSVLFIACCMLGAFYLYQVNSFSTKGFEINTLQSKISVLQEQQRQLQVQSAELQSLQRIESEPDINTMVPVTSVNYISSTVLTQR